MSQKQHQLHLAGLNWLAYPEFLSSPRYESLLEFCQYYCKSVRHTDLARDLQNGSHNLLQKSSSF